MRFRFEFEIPDKMGLGQTRIQAWPEFAPEKKIEAVIKSRISLGMNWLCGTTIISDMLIYCEVVSPADMFKPDEVPEGFLKQQAAFWEFDSTKAGEVKTEYVLSDEAKSDLKVCFRENRDKIFKALFDSIKNKVAAGQNMVLLGGRVTHALEDQKGYKKISCPEFAEYLINNRLGVISASHMHLNSIHQEDREGGFSVYQYWCWTYQTPSTRRPRVANISNRYCGVFSCLHRPREKFLKYWSRTFHRQPTDQMFKQRYTIRR